MRNTKPNFDPQQVARDWLELGVLTVPLKSRSKEPSGGKNWNRLRVTAETIPKHFKKGCNIGALWGKPSGWIVDVDLDLEEACLVAPHILPETFIYGRQNKPSSHYLYRCVECPGSKRVLPKRRNQPEEEVLGMIVELRSTGSQSVLPPSIHEDDGDRYMIYHDVEFADISRLELEARVDEVAIAAVYVHYFPDAGSRHDYVHACTGALCWAGWDEVRVRRVMAAVLSVTQEDDEELQDRMTTVLNTIEHHKDGDRVAGFPTLEDWMSAITISTLRKWMQRSKRSISLEPLPTHPQIRIKRSGEFDRKWLEVPGLVGDIAKWSSKSSYIKQPAFDLATGIMCTAFASSNHYIVDHWDTPLQPYLMLLAPTGDGKAAVLRAITQFAEQVEMDDYIYRGFQSYYAMLDQLVEEPSIALWLWDEAARHIASARSTNSPDNQVLTHVIQMYGSANDRLPGMPGRKQSIPPLDRPFFTLLATAQPDQLMEAITVAAEKTGFTNRFILFDTGDDFPARNRQRTKMFPLAIKEQALKIKSHQVGKKATKVQLGEKTHQMFDEFDETSRRRTHDIGDVWARGNQNALILAGTAAVGVNPRRPTITKELAKWAIEIITWSNDRWTQRIATSAADTAFEKHSKNIEAKIRDPMKCKGSAKSPQHQSLIKQGFMPYSLLVKTTRALMPKQIGEVLDQLCEAEIIGESEMEGQIVYWCKHGSAEKK